MSKTPKADGGRYWYTHAVAMDAAQMMAAQTGVRQRVQPVTWETMFPAARWFIAPTPAPAPATCNCYPGGFTGDTYEGPREDCPVHGRQVAEPCS